MDNEHGRTPDDEVLERINALSRERERIYGEAGPAGGLSPERQLRLDAIKVELDQAYDVLHQLQGLHDAGLSPSNASERSADVVEGYEQ